MVEVRIMNDTHHDLIIVGAGIAGLAAALTSSRAGAPTLVLDAHDIGGRARTAERDGFLHNIGPHALYRSGALAKLLREHDIRVAGHRPDVGAPAMLRDDRLTPVSMKAMALMRTPLLPLSGRIRLLKLLASMQRTDPAKLVGTTVDQWLGGQPVHVRQFADFLVRLSTYSNDPADLDAGAALGQVQLALGSSVDYLHGGWGSMIDSMASTVRERGVAIESHVEVTGVERLGDGWLVSAGARSFTADAVVLAVGGPALVQRLSGRPVTGADQLTAPATATCLDLAVNPGRPLVAFGLDQPLYLSAHSPGARLAPEGSGLVSVLRYIPVGTEPADATTARHELREFARLAGIADRDIVHERYLHQVVVHHGGPSARGGGLAGRPGVDALGNDGIAIAGDWVGEVGFIADASAASGAVAAAAALTRLGHLAA
jgi:phytoene dehydrogenase-like protein